MAANKSDFETVAAAALQMALTLLPQWLGGHREGHEWLGEKKANGGLGDSWKVNLNTGAWSHFGGPEKGGDLVSLYAALNHINQGPARDHVAEITGVSDRSVVVLDRTKPTEKPVQPIPADAPDPRPHEQYGQPSAIYRYGSAFWVARYDYAGGKEFRQFTWREGKWHMKGYGDKKPVYGTDLLINHPTAPVVIVEGEKACHAARTVMRQYVVITWAGGSNAVKNTDWSTLKNREVIIWPDADDPGVKAGAQLATILTTIAKKVRIINPTDHNDGWDAADAVAEGWNYSKIAEWAKEHILEVYKSEAKSKTNGVHPPAPARQESPTIESEYLAAANRDDDYPTGSPPRSAMTVWKDLGLKEDGKQKPHGTLANASIILQRHEYFKGKVWLDSFRGKVYHTLDGMPRLWTDADTRRATAWIQQNLDLPQLTRPLVEEGILHAAECQRRNSLTDWLDSLHWDGIERLDTWLADCMGVERNPYNDAVARNWPISMVARAYQPGCQVDTMPVLEGTMGRGKSRFLEVLAEPWFAAIQIAFGEKDFFQAIQGRWLIEVPDMSGFSRREHTQILATITTRTDVYRKSHGRITEEYPRVTVFAATSETDDYLQDIRGRRRYWPLRCGDINLDALRDQRERVFAEAVVRYRDGATWYEMPDSADEEQLARSTEDLWAEAVLAAAEVRRDVELRTGIEAGITASNLLEDIGVKIFQQTDTEKKRIARIMKAGGWLRSRTNKKRCWFKPDRK